MNPRQRRGLTFILVAMVVAVGTFLAVTSYTASVDSQVGDLVDVYRATEPIPAYTALSAANIEAAEIPKRWVSPTSILSIKDLQGQRVGFPLTTGTILTKDMVISTSSLEPGQREIAINVDQVTGVANRVKSGDLVDIVATFTDVPGLPKGTLALATDVRVISVRGEQKVTKQGENGASQQSVIPVTLALSSRDSMAVVYAASVAKEVRLVGLPTDVGTTRAAEVKTFGAIDLGGERIPEGK